MEGQIFAVAGNDLTIAFHAVLHLNTIAALVLNEAAGSNVVDVVARDGVQVKVPVELAHWLGAVKEADGLIDRADTLFRSEGSPAWLRHQVAVEARLELLKLWDELFGVGSEFIYESENLSVSLADFRAWLAYT